MAVTGVILCLCSQITAAVGPTLPARTKKSSPRSAGTTSAAAHRVKCVCSTARVHVCVDVVSVFKMYYSFTSNLQVTAVSPKPTVKTSSKKTERRLPARLYTTVRFTANFITHTAEHVCTDTERVAKTIKNFTCNMLS